jgi:hypothetical protein
MGDAVNVTVIATGFGRTEDISGMKPDPLPSHRQAAPSRAECAAEKPVARTVVPPEPRDTHVPAFIRRSRREKNSRHLSLVDDFALETEEDLDIPTFLRKEAE